MRARYLALAVAAVAMVGSDALAREGGRGGGGRGGSSSGHSRSGGSSGGRHDSGGARSSGAGHSAESRSAVPRTSFRAGMSYRNYGGRSYSGYRGRNYRYSSYRYRPYYGYRSYRPSFGLYLGSSYYDNYYYPSYGYGYGYAPSYTYDAPYAAEYGYAAPAVAPEGPAEIENENEPADEHDGVAEAEEAGNLRLDIRPADATIYVDNQFRGSGDGTTTLALTGGRHTIEVARPGFVTERRVVDVREGEAPRSLSIALQRAQR